MKEWAVSLCMANRPAFDKFIDTAGEKVAAFLGMLEQPSHINYRERQRTVLARQGYQDAGGQAGDEINQRLGLSGDDVKKFGGAQ